MYFNEFKGVSLSHKNAPVEVRELVALNEEQTKAILLKLKEVLGIAEALILSTCNRTEVYYTNSEDLSTNVITLLLHEKGIVNVDLYEPYFIKLNDSLETTRYLFEVSIGLHSQIIGDIQIINQVKRAYQISADYGMAGPYLHRLLHTIFYANKKVVQETCFKEGAASVSYAAVELVETLINEQKNSPILVVGVGEIGIDTVKTLIDKGYTNISLTNRTHQKAINIAQKFGNLRVLSFNQVNENIFHHDVIIVCLSAPEPLVRFDMFKNYTSLKHKYFIDLSVPRSVETEIENINGWLLYNIDQLQLKANETLLRRKQAIPQVEKIINESLNEFIDWTKEMTVSPTIQKLKNALEQIRQEELSRHIKQLSDVELGKVDLITKNMMQKVLKLPVLQLKAACKRGEAETLIDVLNDLFNLEKEKIINS